MSERPDWLRLKFLGPKDAMFQRKGEKLSCELAGVLSENISVRCAFPVSNPGKYVSVKDSDGKELGMFEDITGLDRGQRRIIEETLRDIYFTPVIERIESVKDQFGSSTWVVVTDRGKRSFTLQGRKSNKIETPDGRLLITDVDANRYEVRDPSALDSKSRAFLGRLV